MKIEQVLIPGVLM